MTDKEKQKILEELKKKENVDDKLEKEYYYFHKHQRIDNEFMKLSKIKKAILLIVLSVYLSTIAIGMLIYNGEVEYFKYIINMFYSNGLNIYILFVAVI